MTMRREFFVLCCLVCLCCCCECVYFFRLDVCVRCCVWCPHRTHLPSRVNKMHARNTIRATRRATATNRRCESGKPICWHRSTVGRLRCFTTKRDVNMYTHGLLCAVYGVENMLAYITSLRYQLMKEFEKYISIKKGPNTAHTGTFLSTSTLYNQ